ncbi:hypothetical protein HK096_009074 [Nowakowskiella sp. JEL0078]|nr:hypothetical protein HK096_009074 [Nowakowskiella sp. JEL0078]
MKIIIKSYNDINAKYEETTNKISTLVKHTQVLKDERVQLKTQKAVAEAFVNRFTLSENEILLLTNQSITVNQDFFSALEHLQQINEDCKVLLITEHQTAGIEIIESMAQYQELAFDRLFKFSQLECRALASEIPEVSTSLRNTMRALRQRPVLSCVDEILHIRRNAILKSFLEALTRGGPGGTPRPIEIHIPDPLRYVGDMLAWLHQAAATEKEMLDGLFDTGTDSRRHVNVDVIPFSRVLSSTNSFALSNDSPEIVEATNLDDKKANLEAIQSILDKSMDRARTDQVFSSHPGPLTAYRIANLVQFYHSTFVKILGPNAKLSQTLVE